jgi:hypothetical protein
MDRHHTSQVETLQFMALAFDLCQATSVLQESCSENDIRTRRHQVVTRSFQLLEETFQGKMDTFLGSHEERAKYTDLIASNETQFVFWVCFALPAAARVCDVILSPTPTLEKTRGHALNELRICLANVEFQKDRFLEKRTFHFQNGNGDCHRKHVSNIDDFVTTVQITIQQQHTLIQDVAADTARLTKHNYPLCFKAMVMPCIRSLSGQDAFKPSFSKTA